MPVSERSWFMGRLLQQLQDEDKARKEAEKKITKRTPKRGRRR